MEKKRISANRFDEEYQVLFSHLKELNYSRRTLNRYINYHEDVMARLKREGKEQEAFTPVLCEWLVQDIIGGRPFHTLSLKEKNEINSLQALLSYRETGSLSVFGRPNKVDHFSGPLGSAVNDYLEHDRLIGRTQGTIKIKSLYLTYMKDYFFKVMELQSWDELTKTGLFSYVESLVRYSPSMITQFLSLLRGLLTYLYEVGAIKENLAIFVPRGTYRSDAKLPTTYSDDEINLLLSSINRASPVGKRDYAIVLLITHLGLRAGDVANLKFNDIDWNRCQISILQQKTKEPLVLPLSNAIGNAIIDYLRYGRPQSDVCEVFLTAAAPYRPFFSGGGICSIVRESFRKSGIKPTGRKQGSHSLRFSLGKRLLEAKTPLPIISAIYGHASTETTMRYIGIDRQALRQCALEVTPYVFKEVSP
jgi:integrase/recombinase XerD